MAGAAGGGLSFTAALQLQPHSNSEPRLNGVVPSHTIDLIGAGATGSTAGPGKCNTPALELQSLSNDVLCSVRDGSMTGQRSSGGQVYWQQQQQHLAATAVQQSELSYLTGPRTAAVGAASPTNPAARRSTDSHGNVPYTTAAAGSAAPAAAGLGSITSSQAALGRDGSHSSRLWRVTSAFWQTLSRSVAAHSSTAGATSTACASEHVSSEVRIAIRVGIATGTLRHGCDVSDCAAKHTAKGEQRLSHRATLLAVDGRVAAGLWTMVLQQ